MRGIWAHTPDTVLISTLTRAVIISIRIRIRVSARIRSGLCVLPSPASCCREQGTGAPLLLALFASSPAAAPTVCTACGWGAEGTDRSAPKARPKRGHIIPLRVASVNQAAEDFQTDLTAWTDVLGVTFCNETGAHLVSLKRSLFMQSSRGAPVGRACAHVLREEEESNYHYFWTDPLTWSYSSGPGRTGLNSQLPQESPSVPSEEESGARMQPSPSCLCATRCLVSGGLFWKKGEERRGLLVLIWNSHSVPGSIFWHGVPTVSSL